MINNNNFISIQGWMVNDLQLSGIDLLVYAIIYGFSQDGESVFSGTLQYLQEWTGASRETVKRSLQRLCEEGMITKIERSGKVNFYKANCNAYDPAQNEPTAQDESDPAQNDTGTRLKMSPDNINNNIYINNINNTRVREKKPKHKYGEYKNVFLTDEDLDKLKCEFPHDWESRIQILSEYIECHGKKYKNHLAVIRTWARNDTKKNKAPAKAALPFVEVAERPEYDDTVFDRILEQVGGGKSE